MITVVGKEYRSSNYLLFPNINGSYDTTVNTNIVGITFNGVLNDDGTYSTAPVWFTYGSTFTEFYWQIVRPSGDTATYNFSFTFLYSDGSESQWLIKFFADETPIRVTLGCDSTVEYLYFLTREGGWQLMEFVGKKSITVTLPEARTYKNSKYTLYNNSRRNVYNGAILSTGSIPEEALELLQELKESIQVYYVDNYSLLGNQKILKAVILQDGDYVKFATGEKRWDVKVKFIYAQERKIQTQ